MSDDEKRDAVRTVLQYIEGLTKDPTERNEIAARVEWVLRHGGKK